MLLLITVAECTYHINRACNNINNQEDWTSSIIMHFMVIATYVTCLAIRHLILDLTNGGEAHSMQVLDLAGAT